MAYGAGAGAQLKIWWAWTCDGRKTYRDEAEQEGVAASAVVALEDRLTQGAVGVEAHLQHRSNVDRGGEEDKTAASGAEPGSRAQYARRAMVGCVRQLRMSILHAYLLVLGLDQVLHDVGT